MATSALPSRVQGNIAAALAAAALLTGLPSDALARGTPPIAESDGRCELAAFDKVWIASIVHGTQ